MVSILGFSSPSDEADSLYECSFLWDVKHQDLVVQSIVSLTISLRHKFVKQISAKVTNTLLFFVEKM